MRSSLVRRVRSLGSLLSVASSAALACPAAVAADCNGPMCEPDGGGVEGPQALLFLMILVLFAAAMAVAEARRR